MESVIPAKFFRVGANLLFLYLGSAGLLAGLLMMKLSRSWTISDWLINYEGGFIRRGLPGQLAFFFGHTLHISPISIVTAFYLSLFVALLFAVRSIVLASSHNLWVIALVVSPATLSFIILHPQAGFRKELIYLAALASLVAILQKKAIPSALVVAYLTIVLALGTLSHEAVIFYAPYFFAALILSGRSFTKAALECALPFAAGAFAFYLCSTHLGGFNAAEGVCSSLGYRLLVPGSTDICSSGAIPYLTKSREMAQVEVAGLVARYHYLAIYPVFTLLALFPAFAESRLLVQFGLKREMKVVWLTSVIALGASLPLFVYGIDWGRWIYIHIFSIAILLIAADGAAKSVQSKIAQNSQEQRYRRLRAAMAFLFLYGTLWALPVSTEPPRLGYMGRVLSAAHITHETWVIAASRSE